MINYLNKKIVMWLCDISDIGQDEIEVIKYGLNLLLETITKILCILIVAVLCNKLTESVIVLITFGLLRSQAGGIHMKSSLGCTTFMFVITFGIAFASDFVRLNNFQVLFILIISVMAMKKYAPRDTGNNPITSESIRKAKKKRSIILTIIMLIFTLIIYYPEIRSLIVLSILVETVTILPKKEEQKYEKPNEN